MAKLETMTVARSYDHKDHGRIGTVTLEAALGDVTLNGTALPQASVEYLLMFSLQSLQDAYAGADGADDAKARWEKKLDRLLEGSIGVRAAGDGASAETKAIRGVIGDMLRAAKVWKAKIGSLDEDKRAAALDAIFEGQSPEKQAALRDQAKARLAEAAKRKAQAAAMADTLEL